MRLVEIYTAFGKGDIKRGKKVLAYLAEGMLVTKRTRLHPKTREEKLKELGDLLAEDISVQNKKYILEVLGTTVMLMDGKEQSNIDNLLWNVFTGYTNFLNKTS